MAEKFKTTKVDFKVFKVEVEYWIDRFSLREWKVFYKHEKSKKLSNVLAWIATDWKGRSCSIGLSPNWSPHDIVSDFEICRSAFHEVCELLLSDIGSIARMIFAPRRMTSLRPERTQ